MGNLIIVCGQIDNVTAVNIKNDDVGENSFLRIDQCMVFFCRDEFVLVSLPCHTCAVVHRSSISFRGRS
jgi:hypothetical protein